METQGWGAGQPLGQALWVRSPEEALSAFLLTHGDPRAEYAWGSHPGRSFG